MQMTVRKIGGKVMICRIHVLDLLVKWPIDDHSEWALLWVSSPSSQKENNGSFKGENTVQLLSGYENTTCLREWNRMGPLGAERFGLMIGSLAMCTRFRRLRLSASDSE